MSLRTYEVLLLLSPELTGEGRDEIVANLSAIIERGGGNPPFIDDWGKRELAYPVQNVMRGHYIRLEFAAPGEVVAELERIIRITEGIFKFVTVKLADEVIEPKAAAAETAPAAKESAAEATEQAEEVS